MKSIKIMLLGIVILLTAVWCAALSGNSGSELGGIAVALFPVGIIISLIGFFQKDRE